MAAIYDTKTLKAGDIVNIAFSSRANIRMQRATVKRVSATGVTTVATGSETTYTFNPDGRQRGVKLSSTSVIKWLETI